MSGLKLVGALPNSFDKRWQKSWRTRLLETSPKTRMAMTPPIIKNSIPVKLLYFQVCKSQIASIATWKTCINYTLSTDQCQIWPGIRVDPKQPLAGGRGWGWLARSCRHRSTDQIPLPTGVARVIELFSHSLLFYPTYRSKFPSLIKASSRFFNATKGG